MNPLVMRLEVAGDAATASGDHNLAALLWEAAAALALSPDAAPFPCGGGSGAGLTQCDMHDDESN